MIWTAAGDYQFDPVFTAYWLDGEPNFYLNSVIGYAHKWYGGPVMDQLFETIRLSLRRETCDGLLWVALENCVYEREVQARPVLEEMRTAYAHTFFEQEEQRSKQQWMAQNSLVYSMQAARCRVILGQDPGLIHPREKRLFQELAYDGGMTDQEIADRTIDILRRYLHFTPHARVSRPVSSILKKLERFLSTLLPSRVVREEALHLGRSADSGGNGRISGKIGIDQPSSPDGSAEKRAYIENCFGRSICTPSETAQIEHLLCTDAHAHCHLHFTDGQRRSYQEKDPMVLKTIRDAKKQLEKNCAHYQERRHLYQNSITRLSEQIRNAILVYPQPLPLRGRTGRLYASEVWRAVHMDDARIFMDTWEEEQPDFSVDLMLDASSSCLDYQETIAAQGYVIAKSLELCHIPVQVSSFLSHQGYTVIRRYREYNNADATDQIFDYFSAGWNRDGLALKGIGTLMENSPCKQRILIILTDASPNDDRKIPANPEKGRLVSVDYSDRAGIEDTVAEVRALQKDGVRVMAILNGSHGDTAAARKIYGMNFTRIERPDQLAAAAGTLILKQLQNLA